MMNNFIKSFSNKKRNSIQNNLKVNEEELVKFSDVSTSSDTQTSSQEGPLLLIDVIVNESQTHFENEIKKLFKDIEDSNQDDSSLIKKLETLLREDGKNFERISDAKIGNENYTMLHYAAKTNRANLSAFFIDELNIDVDSLTKSKLTPLHLLLKNVASNDESIDLKLRETLLTFFERKANLNLKNDQHNTLLHLAVGKQNRTAVAMLVIQSRINLEIKNANQMTALQVACQQRDEEIINSLIDKTSGDHLLKHCQLLHLLSTCKTEKYSSFKNALHKLKETNHYQRTLNSLDANNKTVLELSIENNHLKIIDLILSELNDRDHLDPNGNLPVHLVSKYSNSSLFELLIKHSFVTFKTNSNYENALHIAASNNKYNFIKLILNFEKSFIEKLDATSTYNPMIKCLNKKQYNPLQIALIKKNNKCVEELCNSNHIDLDITDSQHNSIYHLCILNSNSESLRFLLNKKSEKYYTPLFIRTKNNETPLHLACQFGLLDAFKQIITKLNNINAQSIKTYLQLKDINQRTCFHIAIAHNHYNIIEYCLNDLDFKFLLELTDNDSNTCLIIAASYGYTKLVELLVKNGADLNKNNKDLKNAFEISCQNGFYETSKLLINSDSTQSKAIHLAVNKNAYQLVEEILNKGIQVDCLNANKQNCLDIAISHNSQESIKVLLNNKNWYKLFQNEYLQNSQINAMFNHKMYSMLEIVLNNCKLSEQSFDFNVIDPKIYFNIKSHPLMRLAESKQDKLLKHQTTQVLLDLKWSRIPRFLFYFNIILHFVFLLLFTLYSFEVKQASSIRVKRDISQDCSKYYTLLILLISIHLFKFSVVLIQNIRFLFRFESWLEIVTLIGALVSLNSGHQWQIVTFCSIAIISCYLHFILLFQLVPLIGLYIMAFKKCCFNSLKLFPVLFLIIISLDLSYKTTQTSSYLNETLKVTQFHSVNEMSLGYLVFILLSFIVFNLSIGIAVCEVNQLMTKSQNEQIAKRIIFCLRVQNAIKFFNRTNHFKQLFNITYQLHTIQPRRICCYSSKKMNTNSKKQQIESLNKTNNINNQLTDLEQTLSIKQQRIEDSLTELSRKSLDSFEFGQQTTTDKLSSVENNFVKSQVELRNSLFDLKNYVILKFSSLKQSLVQTIRNFEYDSFEQNLKLLTSLDSIHEKTNYVTDSTESIKQLEKDEFKAISNNFLLIDSRLSMFQIELDRLVKKVESVESQITVSDYKLNVIDILVRKETFSARLEQVISKLDDLNERQFNVENALAKLNFDSK